MLKLGVLVSGGGTNLQAIMDAIDSGVITNAEVGLVISNNPGAYALKRAESRGIPAKCIAPKKFENREEFHKALLQELQENKVELVVLAGKRSRTDCSCRLSGCNSTYDRGSISEQNHQYSSIPHSVFLWRRILWSSCP